MSNFGLVDKLSAQLVKSTTPRLDILVLLEFVTHKNRSYILAHPEFTLNKQLASRMAKLIKLRNQSTPIAYITGMMQFYGLDLTVDNRVLIPRPETERLVDYILANSPKSAKLLDIGTGSGAIALAVAHHRADISVTASDISEDALAVANKNSRKLGLKINLVQSDLLESIDNWFDIIVANLPYLPRGYQVSPETNLEPVTALYSGDGGLELYRKLFSALSRNVKTLHSVVIEALPLQREALIQTAKTSGYKLVTADGFLYVFTSVVAG